MIVEALALNMLPYAVDDSGPSVCDIDSKEET
jgi:hypothetical protein